MDLTIFKFNAASKTNSNLLSDVKWTDTNYLMNAIKKHVKIEHLRSHPFGFLD